MHPPSHRFTVDLDDPRAPTEEEWAALTPEERAAVVASLPSEFPVSEAAPPEGPIHFDAANRVRETLDRYFKRSRRNVFIACNMPVYYPGEPMFSPDVSIVLDVEPRERNSWVASAEGRGLDMAIEVLWLGRRAKDLRDNVTRYARLRIPEYFLFDRRQLTLRGWQLSGPDKRIYQPILAQAGNFPSAILGLELAVDGDRLRFFAGDAPLPDHEELISRLTSKIDEQLTHIEEIERRAEEEARRAEEEARRAEEEARRAEEETRRAEEEANRAKEAERRLAEALAELERLRDKK